ncbi:hypothetical protein ACF0H5_017978 [Mactra antiquata]
MQLLQKFVGLFFGLLGFPAQRYICFRPYVLPVIVGLCLGITIHMMFVPFLEEGCDMSTLRRVAARNSKMINSHSTKPSQKPSTTDDFEARIVKHVPTNVSVDKNAVRPKVTRPRYIASELGMKEKLFVAVLTSSNTVDKLGVAMDKTLTKHMTKVIFFSSEKPKQTPSDFTFVAFGDRHHELLPVHVLRYIREHYADMYDFYLFISDRTYLRAERYFDLVEHISVREDVYMGVPGPDRNFCSLEGGALLSLSVLQQVMLKLDWCTSNIHSDNPSITLGRCVHFASQKMCSTRAGDQTLQYYQMEDFDYDSDIQKLKEKSEFNQSLTFFPMPDDFSHYKLHRYFCMVELNTTTHEIEKAKMDIVDLSEHSPGGRDSLSWPLGVQSQYKPANRYSVIQWTYFTDTHVYLEDELTNIAEVTGANKLDIVDVKKFCVEKLNEKYPSQYILKKIINGYRRFDPTRGMEYILDLLLLDKTNRNSETIKRVHLVRPLGKVELVPMPYVTKGMMVAMILPLYPSDVAMFDSFIDLYTRACLETQELARLIVALIYPRTSSGQARKTDPFAAAKARINDISKKFDTKGMLSWKALENVVSDINIMDQLISEFKTDGLILFTTVNVEMSGDLTTTYLNRVRGNTIKGEQVFFPMGFWQYKPNLIYNKRPYPSSVEVGQRLGLFDVKSHDHASFYLSDYQAARKTLSKKSEDIFSMFISYKKFHVFLAVEPNLKLKWMNISCDPHVSTTRYQQCITRNVEGLASQHHLALLVYEQQSEIISQSQSSLHKAEIIPDRNEPVHAVPVEPEKLQPPPPKKPIIVSDKNDGKKS